MILLRLPSRLSRIPLWPLPATLVILVASLHR